MSDRLADMPAPTRFIFHNKIVSRIAFEIEEDGQRIFKLEGGGRAKASEVIEITPDERLVLVPATELTDLELEQALKSLHKQRLTTASESKKTPRTRSKVYQEETGLRLSNTQLALGALDALKALNSSPAENSNEPELGQAASVEE